AYDDPRHQAQLRRGAGQALDLLIRHRGGGGRDPVWEV
ncbi:MAG: hypothetical protein AVDCRST_MAG58-910, partial [uncultured Rubrobacteraceae bacterium]